MKTLFDTSMIVAALVETHPMHERAFPWFKRSKAKEFELIIASHTLAELYAVLSTLPIKPRISPSVAWRLIHENIEARRSDIIFKKGGNAMPRRSRDDERLWMTECDVIRYSLKMPEGMKKKLKKEAGTQGLDMSSYICGVLSGDIKRTEKKKTKKISTKAKGKRLKVKG